jgi:hypothetical protein
MKRYKSQFQEKSINKMYQAVDILYNQYKNKFNSISELIDFISKKLNISKNNVLQILQMVESKK